MKIAVKYKYISALLLLYYLDELFEEAASVYDYVILQETADERAVALIDTLEECEKELDKRYRLASLTDVVEIEKLAYDKTDKIIHIKINEAMFREPEKRRFLELYLEYLGKKLLREDTKDTLKQMIAIVTH